MNCLLTLKMQEVVSGTRPSSTQVAFAGSQVNPPEMYTVARLTGKVLDEETGKPPEIKSGSIDTAKITVSPAGQNAGLSTVNANRCEDVIDGIEGVFSVDPTFFMQILGAGGGAPIELRFAIDTESMVINGGAQLVGIYSFSIGANQ